MFALAPKHFFKMHILSCSYLSGVLGVLYPQFQKTMPLQWIPRFKMFSLHKLPPSSNCVQLPFVNWQAIICLCLHINIISCSRGVPFSQLPGILVHIVGMWYVFVQGERTFHIISFHLWNIFESHLILDNFICLICCTNNGMIVCGSSQETCKIKMCFKGHLDYLYCIVARNSTNQVMPPLFVGHQNFVASNFL